MTLLIAAGWIATSHGGLDLNGKPLGTDFASFWTAAKITVFQGAGAVYDPVIHHGAQKAQFGPDVVWAAFFYPPTFLLICLPLAALPYLAAWLAWLAVTGYAYVRVAMALAGREVGLLAVLAFPALLSNVGHGQNGLLSAALLGGGFLLLDRRPIVAGVLFGLLTYKPHLAMLVPVTLLVTWRWRTLIASGVTAIGFAGLSWVVLGDAAWRGFFATSALARATLEQGLVGHAKMQSTFAAMQLSGASLPAAWLAQLVMSVLALGALVYALVKLRPRGAKGALTVTATLLASPFLLDYDLAVLIVPMAWLLRQGIERGFLPWERILLLAVFVLPAISRTVATSLEVPLAPLVLSYLFAACLRRVLLAAGGEIAPRFTEPQSGSAKMASASAV